LASFALGGVLAYQDKTASAVTVFAYAGPCLVFVFLQGFRRFKGFGLAAELLEHKIEEADRLLGELRRLAVPMAELLFTTTARLRRWSSMVPRRDRHRLMELIEEPMTSIGVTSGTLENSKRDWRRFNVIDLARLLFPAIHANIKTKIKAKEQEPQKFPSSVSAGNVEY